MTRDEVISTETDTAVSQYVSMLNDQLSAKLCLVRGEPDATGLANFITGGDSPLAWEYACEHGESYGVMVLEITEKARDRLGL
jgi:hypothetical protein